MHNYDAKKTGAFAPASLNRGLTPIYYLPIIFIGNDLEDFSYNRKYLEDFKYIYEKLVLFINKIKSSKAYLLIKEKASIIKKEIKENFFISKSRLKEKIVRIYKLLKSKFVK